MQVTQYEFWIRKSDWLHSFRLGSAFYSDNNFESYMAFVTCAEEK